MTKELAVKETFEQDEGRFLITDEMIEDMSREDMWALEAAMLKLVNGHPEIQFEVEDSLMARGVFIRWKRK